MGKARHNVRNVMGSPLKKIEKIWAEDGLVKVLRTDGKVQVWTPKQACQQALGLSACLNSTKVPKHFAERVLAILEKVGAAAREAASQQETPANRKEESVANVLSGRMEDGTKITLGTTPEQLLIQRYLLLYPTLAENEIAVVLRSDYADAQKEAIMGHQHGLRLKAMQLDLKGAGA